MVSLQPAVEGLCCLKPVEEVSVVSWCSSMPRKAPAPQSPAAGLPGMGSYLPECFVLSSSVAGEELPPSEGRLFFKLPITLHLLLG